MARSQACAISSIGAPGGASKPARGSARDWVSRWTTIGPASNWKASTGCIGRSRPARICPVR